MMTIRKRTFMYALTIMFSVTFLLGKALLLHASEIIEITEEDQQECQLLVEGEGFCGAWMNEQYLCTRH